MFNPFTDLTLMEYMYFCWIMIFLLILLIGCIVSLI